MCLPSTLRDVGANQAMMEDQRKQNKCFRAAYIGCVLGFVGKDQCFESDARSYWKPVKGTQQCGGVGKQIAQLHFGSNVGYL